MILVFLERIENHRTYQHGAHGFLVNTHVLLLWVCLHLKSLAESSLRNIRICRDKPSASLPTTPRLDQLTSRPYLVCPKQGFAEHIALRETLPHDETCAIFINRLNLSLSL